MPDGLSADIYMIYHKMVGCCLHLQALEASVHRVPWERLPSNVTATLLQLLFIVRGCLPATLLHAPRLNVLLAVAVASLLTETRQAHLHVHVLHVTLWSMSSGAHKLFSSREK